MLVDTGKIVVRDRIRKDFGDIEELAKDIKENGLINPPVVTPEMELIAGERRLRAMKSLGYPQVEVRVMTVQDALHQLKLEISENENRKEFSFSEKMEWAERLKEEYRKIAEVNSLSGTSVQHGTVVGRVDERVADEVGIGGKTTLRKAEYIKANADEEMIRQLDDGQLSINAAYVKLKKQAEAAEAKLKDVEKERDDLVQEAVEATRAANSATDSREYLRIKDRLAAAEEERREYYEKWQAAKKKDKTEEAVTEAENRVKAEYRKLVDAQERKIKKLEEELDEVKSTPVEHKPIRSIVIDEPMEDQAQEYYHALQNEVGGFLGCMEGFTIQKDFCSYLSSDKMAFIAESLRTIVNRCEEMIGYIKDSTKEAA